MKFTKRIGGILLAMLLLLCLTPTIAFAEDLSRSYVFSLTADGLHEKEANTGDVITVTFALRRGDTDESAPMYAMQNEIQYDGAFFELVPGSGFAADGIETTDLALRDNYRRYYMNFLSLENGANWPADLTVGSFQLRIIGTEGVSKITSENYLVSVEDGSDRYSASAEDVTVILSTDCLIQFNSNGGGEVAPQRVRYGEHVARPEDPARPGHTLAGWYRDIDLTDEWNFETDTVDGNRTLYAKWTEGGPEPVIDVPGPIGPEERENAKPDGDLRVLLAVLIPIAVLAAAAILFFLSRSSLVTFETNGGTPVDGVRVRRGAKAGEPFTPQKPSAIFAGWYRDAELTEPWLFDKDTVKEDTTLYAKWY